MAVGVLDAVLGEAGVDFQAVLAGERDAIGPRRDLKIAAGYVEIGEAFAEPALKIQAEIGARALEIDESVAKISIVGAGIQNAPGYAARMFGTLADAKVNIQMISTSEIRITCIVAQADADRALKALHDTFDLATPDPVDAAARDAESRA